MCDRSHREVSMNRKVVLLTLFMFLSEVGKPSELGHCRETELEGFYLPPKLLSWLQLDGIIKNIESSHQIPNQPMRAMKSEFSAEIEGLPGKTKYRVLLTTHLPGVTKSSLFYLLQQSVVQKKVVDHSPQFVAHAELREDGLMNSETIFGIRTIPESTWTNSKVAVV